jgi:hypothetical protein
MLSSDTPSAGVTWTELAARARTFRLEITFLFETTDPRAIAEQLSDLVFRAIAHATPDEAGRAAQAAVHYAELARQGRRFVGTAVLAGGPPRDRHARDDYHHAFRVLVHQAIRLAGFLLAEDDAFQVWSEHLRRKNLLLKLGTIEDAGEATALLCLHFSAIADADVRREFAPTAHEASARRDQLPPLDTKEQQRAAVDDKLACVSKELELFPPLKHDTEFWKVGPYTDRGAFEDWIETGHPKSADDAFRIVLAMDSPAYYRRLQSWPERRKLAERKKT